MEVDGGALAPEFALGDGDGGGDVGGVVAAGLGESGDGVGGLAEEAVGVGLDVGALAVPEEFGGRLGEREGVGPVRGEAAGGAALECRAQGRVVGGGPPGDDQAVLVEDLVQEAVDLRLVLGEFLGGRILLLRRRPDRLRHPGTHRPHLGLRHQRPPGAPADPALDRTARPPGACRLTASTESVPGRLRLPGLDPELTYTVTVRTEIRPRRGRPGTCRRPPTPAGRSPNRPPPAATSGCSRRSGRPTAGSAHPRW